MIHAMTTIVETTAMVLSMPSRFQNQHVSAIAKTMVMTESTANRMMMAVMR